MDNYTIGITTFSKRMDFLSNLISQIRNQTDADILISINGDYKCIFSEEYRINVLKLCINYQNIFPIFFPEQRGLSKLWNTICIHSKHDWVIILNDDIEINSNDVFNEIENRILSSIPNFYRINGSFSHFVIHKTILEDLSYFDERLLGFGEEDGDILYRYIERYGKNISECEIHGIKNIVSEIRDENIRSGMGKYSWFNRNFIFNSNMPKYVSDDNGIVGMFGSKFSKKIDDIRQYPYEEFFRKNKDKLGV